MLPPGPDWPAIRICMPDRDGRLGVSCARPGQCDRARGHADVQRVLWAGYPHAQLTASGTSVGLPDGQMGNSEVGHLDARGRRRRHADKTLTARSTTPIAGGGMAANEVVRAALSAGERVHLVGMVSDGGVHSGFEHLRALIELAGRLDTPDPCSTASSTAVTPHRSQGEHYLHTLPKAGAPTRVFRPAWPPSSAAFTQWTAIIAGSARRPPTT